MGSVLKKIADPQVIEDQLFKMINGVPQGIEIDST
jgi:hypothetical protein